MEPPGSVRSESPPPPAYREKELYPAVTTVFSFASRMIWGEPIPHPRQIDSIPPYDPPPYQDPLPAPQIEPPKLTTRQKIQLAWRSASSKIQRVADRVAAIFHRMRNFFHHV